MAEHLPPKLAEALIKAQCEARAVPKDARNGFHNYRYASAESMIDEGRLALGSAGLSLMQGDVDFVVLSEPLEQGKERSRVMLRITYVLAHASGERHTFTRAWPAVESNGRPIDKAFGGALTTALSYTIRDVLLLPRDDEKAAMDRRDDKDDEPARIEDRERDANPPRRDPKPANDAGPEFPPKEEPAPTAGAPRDAEHPFVRLLPLVQSRALASEPLANDIAKANLTDDERAALGFVVRAFEAKSGPEIAKLGAEIRKSSLGERLRTWTLKAIRPAWDELHKEPEQKAAS